jgi:phage shock protein A
MLHNESPLSREDQNSLELLENPELLLKRAMEEWARTHAKNRERAEQAFAQRDNLQRMVEDMEQRMQTLERDAREATEWGLLERAERIRAESQAYQSTIDVSRVQLEKATVCAGKVKEAIEREAMKMREKTAEAHVLMQYG